MPAKWLADASRLESVMPTITPFLWFDTQAEDAMNFYTSIFENSKVIAVNRAQGKVFSVVFELEGQKFMGLNAGPVFKFNEAVSFFIEVETQAELDEYWTKLTAGGGAGQCGWLKDKFGLSWQVVPKALGRMMSDPDPAKVARVMQCIQRSGKLDIKQLQQAYEGN
jgi:predicted 3-demethylubiquinone-9 3-methyltransferase (glyoxalase superfamily)